MNRTMRLVLVAVALLAAAVAVFWRGTPTPATPTPATPTPANTPTPPADSDAARRASSELAAAGAEEVPRVIEETIALGGTLTVRVTSKTTGLAVAKATVTASIDVYPADAERRTLSFDRSVPTNEDGVADFDHFPQRRPVSVRVKAEGFRDAWETVNLTRKAPKQELAIALIQGLSAREASVAVAFDKGVDVPGARVLVDDRVSGRHQFVEIGGLAYVDDDPTGAAEHVVDVQLVLPGYASVLQPATFRRGSSVVVKPPSEAKAVQEIAFVDETGRGVEDVGLRIWPASARIARMKETLLVAKTDARGVAAIPGYVGTVWDVEVDERFIHVFERLDVHPVVVGSGLRTVTCGRRVGHRLILKAEQLAEVGLATANWTSYVPMPRSPIEAMFHADEASTPKRIERYRASLTTRVPWALAATGGRHEAPLALLPGIYVVGITMPQAQGPELTLEVVRSGGETVVSLATSHELRVQIEGSFDRTDGLLPFATAIFGHRAGFDERISLLAGLVRWKSRSASPTGGSELDERFAQQMFGSEVARTRAQSPGIGPDLGFVDRDGVAEVPVYATPTYVTVLFPDGRAAGVAVEGDATRVRGRVEPASFRWLTLRMKRSNGEAFGGCSLCLDSVERIRRGSLTHDVRQTADRAGIVRIPIVPGDIVGLDPVFDRWHVTPIAGTSIEQIAGGDAPRYAVTTSPDVAEPTVEISVEPFVQPGK